MAIATGQLCFSQAEARVVAAALDFSACLHEAAGSEECSEVIQDIRSRFVALAQELDG